MIGEFIDRIYYFNDIQLEELENFMNECERKRQELPT